MYIHALTFVSNPSQPLVSHPLTVLDHHSEHRFRSKYHPDEASRLEAEAHSALQNRQHVFLFLMESGWFDNVSLDIECAQGIMKVLDAGKT